MNLGVIETHLVAAVERAVAPQAAVRAGPPVPSAVTGMRFDIWVHAARFEDLGGITAEGAVVARRPVRLPGNRHGFAEERPARIIIEVTCTGPTGPGVQAICGALPPPVLIALETMPPPVLSSAPKDSVVLRFADFRAVLGGAELIHHVHGDAAFFRGTVRFQLDGYLHVTVTRRGGVARPPAEPEPARRALAMRVVQGPAGADVTGEHVVITNTGRDAVRLDGFVLHDAAPRRPHRFVFPAFSLPGAAAVRVWTRKGRRDAENLYWGRAKSVWNHTGDTATLLDASGKAVARARYPEHPRKER